MGESNRAAIASRYADMTNELASDCANRMKIEEKEAATTASASTAPTGGRDTGFCIASLTLYDAAV